MSNRAGSGEACEFLSTKLQGANIGIALKCMATDHAIDCTGGQAVGIEPTDHGVLAFPAHETGHGQQVIRHISIGHHGHPFEHIMDAFG